MTYRGTVRDGVIELEPGTRLPDGQVVEIRTLDESRADNVEPRPWAEVFADVIGKAQGLPADAARNHDHYLAR